MLRRSLMGLSVAFLLLAVCGCGTYKSRTMEGWKAFYQGNFETAAKVYAREGAQSERDRLLALLDEGMVLQCAHHYEQSNDRFQKADALIERLNFAHVGAQVVAVVTDDKALPYVGEEFEDVLVNAFGALNYLMAGGPKAAENALIECRRLDWKLKEFAELKHKEYLQSAFARYISGIAYEMDNEPNDAYIDYKTVHKLRPDFEPVKKDLIRLARVLGFQDDAAEWEKQFGMTIDRQAEVDTGNIVIFYQCGLAPEKIQRDDILDLPVYQRLPFKIRGVEFSADGQLLGRSQIIEDIEAVAIKTLDDRMAPIVARRLASTGLKAAAAIGVRQAVKKKTENSANADMAGMLVFMALSAASKADTRSWLTLPGNVQVFRARLPAGTHTINVRFLDGSGNPLEPSGKLKGVLIRKDRITLLTLRSRY